MNGRPSSAWSNACKDYGQKYEPAALKSVQTFLKPSGLFIEEPILYISKSHAFLTATPDGIIRNQANEIDTVVEVTSPYLSRYTCKRPKWVIKNTKDGTYELKYKSRYYFQVQSRMFVTGARQCISAVFTPKITYLMIVNRDENFILSPN